MGEFSIQNESALIRLDEKRVSLGISDILCFSCVRNETLRLPYFLEYHRKMGVNRFFFIDNDSDDGTSEYLLSQPDVHLFFTSGSYAKSRCGIGWLNELLNRYAPGHWTLTLDADELLVFPDCERLNIQHLVHYLDDLGADSFATFLLDIYSDKPIQETIYLPGEPFLDTCPYFDGDSYHKRDSDGIPIEGGPRLRLFSEQGGHTPHLRKVPLVKWRLGMSYESGTHVIENVSLSKLTGALLHFKFFSGFQEHVEQEVERKEHWEDATEYKLYLEGLNKHPGMNLHYEESQLYEGSFKLVEMGLMQMPETFKHFAASHL